MGTVAAKHLKQKTGEIIKRVRSGERLTIQLPTGGDEKEYNLVIDGQNGYLSPGMIDMHWHMAFVFYEDLAAIPVQYASFLIARDAEAYLIMKKYCL